MRFVVDANVLFSFFWKDSFTRRLLIGKYFELCAPEFALEEIDKYKNEIMRRAKIRLDEFVEMRRELILYVEFFPISNYVKFLSRVVEVSPDRDDVDYFALALKLSVGIWSNDKLLKGQSVVGVLNTMEILDFVDDRNL